MELNGKRIAQLVLARTGQYIAKHNLKLKLVILANPDDVASKVYVKNKINACDSCGIACEVINMSSGSTTKNFIEKIHALNNDDSVTAIIAQLPMPQGVDEAKVIAEISPYKDADGFTKLSCFAPCTPQGVMTLINYYNGNAWLKGKNAVVVGRSNIVGKPLAKLLLEKDATVTICHSHTSNIEYYTQNADIVVMAVGKPKFLTADMVKPNATIIDVGINRVDGKLCGDVDYENVSKICNVTPVPGGIGPMTVATLVETVLKLHKVQQTTKLNQQEKI